jgi:hypothetical protein
MNEAERIFIEHLFNADSKGQIEIIDEIIEAIKKLKDEEAQSILIWFYVDELTDRQIAERLKSPKEDLGKAEERFKKRGSVPSEHFEYCSEKTLERTFSTRTF